MLSLAAVMLVASCEDPAPNPAVGTYVMRLDGAHALPLPWVAHGTDTLSRIVADTIVVLAEPHARHVRVWQQVSRTSGDTSILRTEDTWTYVNRGHYLRFSQRYDGGGTGSWAAQREGSYLINHGNVYQWLWELDF